ncbi:MAG: MYXO-CTERM sorting domain-containing protein [Myxococcales bacterium]|nr:MYXO-CTERM sorting domain-containing protein [Myxococcales bacterium]
MSCSTDGASETVEDNRGIIGERLAAHNATVPGPSSEGGCRTPGSGRKPTPLAAPLLAGAVLLLVGRRRH